ncbi:MAG: acetyl-CoA C-acyltransferase, partial [Actinomycetia bacterium]|nr:acetyl-CoA C-acyltransferase [Actinomycetes bacterium]
HLLMDSRAGYKYGDVTVLDHMAYDGLHDVFTDQPMGALTEQRNDVDQFTRAEQDEFAAASHQKAAAAWKDGVYADEVVPVSIPQRKGDPIEFAEDEGIRANTTAQSLAGLRPAFRKDGTITAGSASQISDGACAVVVMNRAKAEEMGLSWLCEIGAHGVVAGPDSTLQSQPANAIRRAVAKEGISVDDLDVIEINEAFSAVALASARELGLDAETMSDKVNSDGGAIAIGHPIGMSGARITLHAALALARLRGARSDGDNGRPAYAVAALCGAGGQGDALILRCP